MLAKGGFLELTDADVTGVVDYMVAKACVKAVIRANPAGTSKSVAAAARPLAQIDDAALAANVKAALGRTRGLVARDINTGVDDGVVTLAGVVDNAEQVDRAEAVVKKLRGVREVRNKLIQSSMFVWD